MPLHVTNTCGRYYLSESDSRLTFLLLENFDGPLILTGSSSEEPSEQLLYVFKGRVLLIIILIASRSLFLCSLVISHFFMHLLSIFVRVFFMFSFEYVCVCAEGPFYIETRAPLLHRGGPIHLFASLTHHFAPGHESDIGLLCISE